MSNATPAAVRKYLASLGRKGGAVKSEAKSTAARFNARKPRPGRRKNAKT